MDVYSILWKIHAILMAAAFAAMTAGFLIVITARKTKWWFRAHRGLGLFGGIGAVAALLLAVIMIAVTHGYHFSNLHTLIGIIAMGLIVLSFILPQVIKKTKKEARRGLRILHMAGGGLSMALMLAAVLLGVVLAGII